MELFGKKKQEEQESEQQQAGSPEKTKAEKFAEDPDAFIDMREAMLVVIKKTSEKGDSYGVANNCTNIRDLMLTWGHAEESYQNRRDGIRMEQMKNRHGGIVLPGQPGYQGMISKNGKHKGAFGG